MGLVYMYIGRRADDLTEVSLSEILTHNHAQFSRPARFMSSSLGQRLTMFLKKCLPRCLWLTFNDLRLWRRHNQRVAFFISTLFLGTFLVILPILCRDWAYSKYHYMSFKTNTEYLGKAAALNTNRVSASKYYLSQLNAEAVLRHFTKMEEKKDISIAVGIVTISRSVNGEPLGYVTQVASKFMDLFESDKLFKNKVLFLCDAEPTTHSEAEHLGKYIPRYRRFSEGQRGEANTFEKEKADYIFCLQKALSYQPKYVLIIEDDAVPRENLFQILYHVLHNLVEKRYSAGDHVHNPLPWAYLKLYYPERWQGFSNELRHVGELLGCALLGGLVFLYTCWFIERRHTTHPAYYYVIGCVYTALVVLLVGRQYLIELRRAAPSLYSVVDAPDCCSPAILYSKHMAAELADYLSGVKCSANFPIDFAMDKFAQTHRYKRYLVEPNIVRHIGLISSLKGTQKKASEFLF